MAKKHLFLYVIMLVLLISLPSIAKASEEYQDVDYEIGNSPTVDLSDDNTMYEANSNNEKKPTPRYGPTNITYKITKKEIIGRGWGNYRNGPSGTGPATLGINHSTTVNREFTNTISGEFPIGEASIGQSLGVTIGKAKTYGTSYSITIPKGKKQQIVFRPEYVIYKVTQRLYANGIASNTYKYAEVKVFDSWDYDYNTIY